MTFSMMAFENLAIQDSHKLWAKYSFWYTGIWRAFTKLNWHTVLAQFFSFGILDLDFTIIKITIVLIGKLYSYLLIRRFFHVDLQDFIKPSNRDSFIEIDLFHHSMSRKWNVTIPLFMFTISRKFVTKKQRDWNKSNGWFRCLEKGGVVAPRSWARSWYGIQFHQLHQFTMRNYLLNIWKLLWDGEERKLSGFKKAS